MGQPEENPRETRENHAKSRKKITDKTQEQHGETFGKVRGRHGDNPRKTQGRPKENLDKPRKPKETWEKNRSHPVAS